MWLSSTRPASRARRKSPANASALSLKSTKYRERAVPLIEWFGDEAIALGMIDRAAVAEYVRWREAKDAAGKRPASKTIGGELALLRQLLQWAVEWQDDTGVTSTRLTRLPRLDPSPACGWFR